MREWECSVFFMKEIYQDLRDKRRTMEEIVEEVRDSLKMARQVSEMGCLIRWTVTMKSETL